MFLELIATIAAGFAAAGIILVLNHLSGGRLPKSAMPICAGLAMLGFAVWSEYTWFPRTQAGLPEGVEVAQPINKASLYRPWTYLAPFVTRFVAVDRLSVRTNEAVAGTRMVDLILMGRWAPVQKVRVMFDCDAARRVDIVEGIEFDADGRPPENFWRGVEADDPVLTMACAEA